MILVGAGPRGIEHLALWERLGAEVVAVVDQNAKRLRHPALSTAAPCASLVEALARFPAAPIVDICTPPASHLEIILESVRSGRHVLCEKPFVANSVEADIVQVAARATNVMVVVMHNWIGAPVFRELLTTIDSGALGEIVAVNCSFINTHSKDIMGMWDESHWVHGLRAGRLEETMPHVVYTVLALLRTVDVEVESVSCEKVTAYPWVTEDTAVIVLRDGHRLVTVLLGVNSEVSTSRIEVVGSKEILEARFFFETLEFVGLAHQTPSLRGLLDRGQWLGMGAVRRLSTLFKRVTGVLSRRLEPGDLWIMREFLTAVENKSPPPVSLEEAVATVKLTEVIIERIVAARSQK